MRASELKRRQVAEWHGAMAAIPFEANRALAAFSKMMELATTQWDIVGENPCRGVRRFSERRRERFLNGHELRSLAKALHRANGSEHSGALLAIQLLAMTGMRLGEVLALKWTDIDLERGFILLSEEHAKTGARTVTLGKATVQVLSQLERTSEIVCEGFQPGKKVGRSSLYRVWNRVCEDAELQNLRPHDLRHSAATTAALAGANTYAVRDLLGHRSLAMSNRYVERAGELARSAADVVAASVAEAFDSAVDEITLKKKEPSDP